MPTTMERLLAAKATAVEAFLATRPPRRAVAVALLASGRPEENVVGVGIGAKLVKGKPTRKPSVRFYVRRKIGVGALARSMVLPGKIDGVATDVIETGTFRAQPGAAAAVPSGVPREQRKMRPARPGCSIGFQFTGNMSGYVMAGTFGALVTKDGRRFILSNNHVLANENALAPGAPIFQPGLLDGGNPATDQIARLSQFVKLEGGGKKNDVDAAIAEILPGNRVASGEFLPRVGHLRSSEPLAAEEGMPVAKVGRTTSYTTGKVFDVSADVSVQYEFGVAVFRDQILVVGSVGSFSAGGDSGSLIVHRQKKRPVALLFAGSDTHTIGNPIPWVLDALGVTIVA